MFFPDEDDLMFDEELSLGGKSESEKSSLSNGKSSYCRMWTQVLRHFSPRLEVWNESEMKVGFLDREKLEKKTLPFFSMCLYAFILSN